MNRRSALHTRAWIGLAAAAAFLAACSSASGPASSGGPVSSTSAGSGSAAGSTEANSSQMLASMEPVTKWVGPTQPFKPPAHKHIMILLCGAQGGGCVREAAGAVAATKALGWTATVVDGKFDPTTWNQAIKQAADSGVDGIIDLAGNPNLLGDAMAAVRAHHVPLVLMSQSPTPSDVAGIDSYIRPDPVAAGRDVAQWIAVNSRGNAHVLIVDVPGYPDILIRDNTIVSSLKSECKQCVVYRISIAAAAFATALASSVTSQLQAHPDINYVWSPDDALSDFIQQGIQQAGKTTTVKLVSGAGAPEILRTIKTGQDAADLATGDQFEGWLAFDSLARVIAGVPVQKLWSDPQRMWTAANINQAPAQMFTSGWDPEFNYMANFEKLWGLG